MNASASTARTTRGAGLRRLLISPSLLLAVAAVPAAAPAQPTGPRRGDKPPAPAWKTTDDRQVRLRFRLAPGDRTEYAETQRSKIITAGKATEMDISATKVLTVERVADDGSAEVAVALEGIALKVAGKSRPWPGPTRGRFLILPGGRL